jgi:hypothetical protein
MGLALLDRYGMHDVRRPDSFQRPAAEGKTEAGRLT